MTKLENMTLSFLEDNCICHKVVLMVSGTGALSSTGPKKKKAVIVGKSNIFRFNHFSKLTYTTLLRCLRVEFVWKIKWFVVVRLKVVSCFSCINCI